MRTTPSPKLETLLPDAPKAPKEAPLPLVLAEDHASFEDIENAERTPPPTRPSGTIKVRLIYGGRAKPAPIADPDDEMEV